jgi:hypothetical protein
MFTDGEKVYFRLGPNGKIYIIPPDPLGLDRDVLGSATIDRVDAKTNTIWLSTPLPDSVKNA